MRVTLTRNVGMLLLGIWLVLTGLGSFGIGLPAPIMGILAIAAGVFILIGR